MDSIQTLLEEIKHSPRLPDAVEELTAFWADERRRRQQFYADLNEDIHAEFIEGKVVVHSPVRDMHNVVVKHLTMMIGTYVGLHAVGALRVEKTMIELPRNSFEPDLCFFRKERGLVFDAEQMYYPAPDWVCEVLSPSTERSDRGVKKTDYALNGVEEYWILDPMKKTVEQYLLENDDYALNFKSTSGDVESSVIRGLAIPVAAIFDERLAVETIGRFYTS